MLLLLLILLLLLVLLSGITTTTKHEVGMGNKGVSYNMAIKEVVSTCRGHCYSSCSFLNWGRGSPPPALLVGASKLQRQMTRHCNLEARAFVLSPLFPSSEGVLELKGLGFKGFKVQVVLRASGLGFLGRRG